MVVPGALEVGVGVRMVGSRTRERELLGGRAVEASPVGPSALVSGRGFAFGFGFGFEQLAAEAEVGMRAPVETSTSVLAVELLMTLRSMSTRLLIIVEDAHSDEAAEATAAVGTA